MNRVSDQREALIAEALGDFVKLLDRIEAVRPRLEQTTSRMERTGICACRSAAAINVARSRISRGDTTRLAGFR